jgi:hypothetical protein
MVEDVRDHPAQPGLQPLAERHHPRERLPDPAGVPGIEKMWPADAHA